MKNKWMLIWGAILAALAFLWKFALVLLVVYITVAIIKKIFFPEEKPTGWKTWR